MPHSTQKAFPSALLKTRKTDIVDNTYKKKAVRTTYLMLISAIMQVAVRLRMSALNMI